MLKSITVGFALLSAACPASAASFFGIELGAPFAAKACDLNSFSTQNICERARSVINHPWGSIDHDLMVPTGISARGISAISVTEFHGVVVRIEAATFGASSQHEVYKDLVSKFGKPSSVQNVPMKNAFGASLLSIPARWNLVGCSVSFKGVAASLDSGEIKVANEASASEVGAGDAWRAKNEPSKM